MPTVSQLDTKPSRQRESRKDIVTNATSRPTKILRGENPIPDSIDRKIKEIKRQMAGKPKRTITFAMKPYIREMYMLGVANTVISGVCDLAIGTVNQLVIRNQWSKMRTEARQAKQAQLDRAKIEGIMTDQVNAEIANNETWLKKMEDRAKKAGLNIWDQVDTEIAGGDPFRTNASVQAAKGIVGTLKDLHGYNEAVNGIQAEQAGKAINVILVSNDYKPVRKVDGMPGIIEVEDVTELEEIAREKASKRQPELNDKFGTPIDTGIGSGQHSPKPVKKAVKRAKKRAKKKARRGASKRS